MKSDKPEKRLSVRLKRFSHYLFQIWGYFDGKQSVSEEFKQCRIEFKRE